MNEGSMVKLWKKYIEGDIDDKSEAGRSTKKLY